MALLKKLMCFKTQANFDEQLAAGEINDYSIVFIQDTQKIWTHQTYFGSTGDLSDYYTKNETYSKEEVDALIGEIENAINDLSDKVSELENSQVSVEAGDNVTVTKDGNVYTVSAEFDTSNLATKDELSDVSDKVDSNSSSIENLQEQVTETESGLAGKQDKITAGTGLVFDGDTLNCTIDDTLFVVVTALPSVPSEGDEHKIHLVPLSTTGTDNNYAEYLWVDEAWEKFGELTAGVDLSGYYTSAQIDSLLSDKQDKLEAGSNISINGNVISATDTTYSNATTSTAGLMSASDKSTLDSISGAVTSVSASGTAPLTLSGSISSNALSISGSVANATASTAGVVKPYSVLSSAPSTNSPTTTSGRYYYVSTNSNNVMVVNVPWTDTTYTLSGLGGIDTVSASGTSPLTLSASKSGTAVTISGSVDLSSYATTASLSDYAKTSDLSAYAKTSDLDGYMKSSDMAAITDAEIDALF